jgi:DNA-directed RNA polymerase subunit RPC12/RpoP
MAKIKISCPRCDRLLQCEEDYRGSKVKCPHCKGRVTIPQISVVTETLVKVKRRVPWKKILPIAGITALVLSLTVIVLWIFQPVIVRWPDRRPVGMLFLASNFHASATNPRGWFNNPDLNFTGTNGPQRFRAALLDYADRSIEILKRTGAQGVIVWDLEGEQYPHKTSYIGDPRLLERLAPEMATAADEFFARLRSAGFKVGVTIRPQQIVFDYGYARQTQVLNVKRTLLEKIDYARKRWGATMFYVDSTSSFLRPDEFWQLRGVAQARPDILLIPEHHYLPYWAFSAPYIPLRRGEATPSSGPARKIFHGSFAALDVGDAADNWGKVADARAAGDILLFRAWVWSPECQMLESIAHTPR